MVWKLDEIDRKILAILGENAHTPNEKLGKKVGLSEPAARRRVAALVSHGVIRRFTIDVAEGGGVSSFVFISTPPDVSSEKMAKMLSSEEGVSHIWELSGESDVAILLSAPDMEELNRRLDEIRAMRLVKKTSTSIIMKKWK